MNIHRIEFEVTYRCNSHCKHCQVEDTSRSLPPAAIDPGLAVDIVKKISSVYHPTSVMTFGGEPLLYLEIVCDIHRAAMQCGIPNRQVITNAGIPRSIAQTRYWANRLAESGVNDLCISVDAFHQEFIPLEIVERNVQSYLDAGIPKIQWNPCWVISEEDDNPFNQQTHTIIQRLSSLPVQCGDGNILQPVGNAQTWLKDYLPSKKLLPTGSCEDVPYGSRLDQIDSISINPEGGICICYDWVIGNANKQDVLDILKTYDPSSILESKAILTGGMDGLAELAQSKGIQVDPQGYYSICDMCQQLRRRLRSVNNSLLDK